MGDYYSKNQLVSIELVDSSTSLSTILKWVQSIVKYPKLSVYDAKPFAEILKAGECWHPELNTLDIMVPLYGEFRLCEQMGPCLVKVEVEESDFEKDRKIQAEYWELCRRGAEGDAEAAIAFCKAEMANKVSHGAFA
jgi:hypothetical protein